MNVHFSSKTDMWSTPQAIFAALDAEFHFVLDVCATKENTKCDAYYDEAHNGLNNTWSYSNWMNPPYGREIGKWVRKASENPLTVCLLPARTDTRWLHDFIYNKAEIRFLKGRIKFGDSTNNAPFPSMVVIFRRS